MKLYKPDRRGLASLRILVLASAILLIAAVRLFIKIYPLMLTLSIIFALTAVYLVFVYMPLYFSRLSYSSDGIEIKKTSGVFFRTNQSIKYSSVQYSTFVTTPFSGLTGLNFIIFYVYGGKCLLLFLRKSDAQEILKQSGCLYIGEE
ncbi:MAG: PH domain-containing protein [Ruminococcus sp.]|nr:PH domain-containing protein [Ruminococcus sp.]